MDRPRRHCLAPFSLEEVGAWTSAPCAPGSELLASKHRRGADAYVLLYCWYLHLLHPLQLWSLTASGGLVRSEHILHSPPMSEAFPPAQRTSQLGVSISRPVAGRGSKETLPSDWSIDHFGKTTSPAAQVPAASPIPSGCKWTESGSNANWSSCSQSVLSPASCIFVSCFSDHGRSDGHSANLKNLRRRVGMMEGEGK